MKGIDTMKMRKTTAMFLALALACSMNITAFAADTSPKTVTEDGGTAVAEVKGTYEEGQSAAKVYKVDIEWTDLSFTYKADPDT